MKQKVLLLICSFCLVAGSVLAQSPSLRVFANSQPVEGTLEIASYNRIALVVEDGMPRDAGYAYEFSAIQLIPKGDGTPSEFRKSVVEITPVSMIGMGPRRNADLLGEFTLRLEWVKRYNPDGSIDLLEIPEEELSIPVYLHE